MTVETGNPGFLRLGKEIDILIDMETAVCATEDRYNAETLVWNVTEGTIQKAPVRE